MEVSPGVEVVNTGCVPHANAACAREFCGKVGWEMSRRKTRICNRDVQTNQHICAAVDEFLIHVAEFEKERSATVTDRNFKQHAVIQCHALCGRDRDIGGSVGRESCTLESKNNTKGQRASERTLR